jgi:circadian clock protein KaiC
VNRAVTTVFTSLQHDPGTDDPSVSSLIDNWVQLRNLESGDHRDRGLFIQKARGMAHSHQIRGFVLTDSGIKLLDVVTVADGKAQGRVADQTRGSGKTER